MASTKKLGGETIKRDLKKACVRLRCNENAFLLSVSTAIRNKGVAPCEPGDAGCVNAQAVPYIKAVLTGKQTRLPLRYIEQETQGRMPPPSRRSGSTRASATVRR